MCTGSPDLTNPETEVAGKVDGISPINLACAMFLVQELAHEVVANQWCKICIAYCGVLCLRNVNVLLFILFLLFNNFRLFFLRFMLLILIRYFLVLCNALRHVFVLLLQCSLFLKLLQLPDLLLPLLNKSLALKTLCLDGCNSGVFLLLFSLLGLL
jgi:hypothetical protein